MNTRSKKKKVIPRYIKYFFVLASVVLTVYVVNYAQSIINPLLFAFFMTVILTPLCSYLERLHFPRLLSSLLCTVFLLIALLALISFFSLQIANITYNLPSYGILLDQMITKSQRWITDLLGITSNELINLLKNSLQNLLRISASFFTQILSGTATVVTTFFLFFISLFFLLYYRTFFLTFIYKFFSDLKNKKIEQTLDEINATIKQYVIGLFIVILIVSVLNIIGLYALGLQYAVFFGILASLLTIIPYIGILIGALIPALFALATKNSLWYPIGVILIFSFIQFLEGNIITPYLMGSRVNINAFFAILALLFGGMLLGAVGLILAIPLLGIFKIICDKIPSLKSIGFIIGTPEESEPRVKFKLLNLMHRFMRKK